MHDENELDLENQEQELEPEHKPESVRETLERVVAESQARDEDDSSEAESLRGSEPVEKSTPDNSGPVRDSRGRFLTKKGKEPQQDLDQAPSDGSKEESTAPIPPPVSWSADAKRKWASLPRELQEYVTGRERDLTQFGHSARRELADIEQAIAGRKETWARQGKTTGQVFRQFLSWDDHLMRNRESAILELAQAYGVSPQQLAQHMMKAAGHNQAQPQAQFARDPRIDQLLAERQQEKAWVQQQRLGQAQSEAETWLNELDESGQPLRPYVTELGEELSSLVAYMRNQDPAAPDRLLLDRAYAMALAGRPDLQAEIERQRQESREMERMREQKERVNKARRAGSSITGAPTGTPGKVIPKDRRELIRAVMNGEL